MRGKQKKIFEGYIEKKNNFNKRKKKSKE